ncbi:MAG: ABC transporter ATP-binding protein [Candidatus Megaira endosymbiont of Mesostigma viride]|jgi:capsular polysaccharide transport system ATP-binding protein|nr:MAG: ABC transporter ATP-binding protein [Candidatus Megaira endosymbiont of Mesostigma viride]HJK88445.1 ABC transporter ATP-binding protein [Candidatus Megaira endosymbiont of Mesostigma viride]
MISLKEVTKKFLLKEGKQKYVFRDLTLTLPKANLALLGKNGAGKSTMISLIAGTQMPDYGKIIRHCNVSWPIGLQSGFQGSLTGRENVLFVCRIQGCSLYATKRKISFVEEFVELDKYFDMPVKTYSSGMKAKLGFGLSMAFDFDLYLIDEVTAVGDLAFQKKAAKVFEEKRNKANIIMVSHDMSTIKKWCNAGLYLENGTCQFYENIDEAIIRYKAI